MVTEKLYNQKNHKWQVFQAQADAALIPSIAHKKGAPFDNHPVDLLIGSNLQVSNIVYKLLERLIVGGSSMIVTQGLNYPAMDVSRGDSVSNIANVIAACSVKAQILESQVRYGIIDEYFLNL